MDPAYFGARDSCFVAGNDSTQILTRLRRSAYALRMDTEATPVTSLKFLLDPEDAQDLEFLVKTEKLTRADILRRLIRAEARRLRAEHPENQPRAANG